MPKKRVDNKTKKDSISGLSFIDQYLVKEFNSKPENKLWGPYIITDSLNIKSLNATLCYAFTKTYDDNEFILIRNNSTDQVFKIVRSFWATRGMYPSPDIQLMILESEEEEQLEPVNYDFLGLEAFLNSCESLQDKELDIETLDSILAFGYEDKRNRIKTADEVLKVLQYKMEENCPKIKTWNKRIHKALTSKLKYNSVLLYGINGIISYFEISPYGTYGFYKSINVFPHLNLEEEYKRQVKGNFYNIRAFRITNSCNWNGIN